MTGIVRIKTVTILAAIAIVSACGAIAGCRADFAPYNRLTSLRVLGIKSDHPATALNETTTLSALVYTPPGQPEPTYSWSWCPVPGSAQEGYPCRYMGAMLDDATLAQIVAAAAGPAGADVPVLPPLFLGSDPTAQLTNVIDPRILTALCIDAITHLPSPTCANGFPVQIRLTIKNGDAPDQTVDAVTTTRWRLDPALPGNKNPEITLLTATRGGNPQTITDDGVVTLPRDVSTPLQALVAMDQSEIYTGLDDNQQSAQLKERLFMTWFVESGGTAHSRTSWYPDKTSYDDFQKNDWTPGLKKDYAPDTARLYVVVHDNRGGVSFAQGLVNLVDPTP